MNENEIIKSALKEKLLMDIDFYNSFPNHHFSHRFNKKIRKLFKKYNSHQDLCIPLHKKLKMAIIAVILAVLLTGAAFGVYTIWEKYRVKDYGLYSILHKLRNYLVMK